MMHHATKRGFKDCPGFLNSTGRLGPKRGRKCYITPAFSGVPNKGNKMQEQPEIAKNELFHLIHRETYFLGCNRHIWAKSDDKCTGVLECTSPLVAGEVTCVHQGHLERFAIDVQDFTTSQCPWLGSLLCS